MFKSILNVFWMSKTDAVNNILFAVTSNKLRFIKPTALDALYEHKEVLAEVNRQLAFENKRIEPTNYGIKVIKW